MSLKDLYDGLKWCYNKGEALRADEAEAARLTQRLNSYVVPILKRLERAGKVRPGDPATDRLAAETKKLEGLLKAIAEKGVVKQFFCAGDSKTQLQAAEVRPVPVVESFTKLTAILVPGPVSYPPYTLQAAFNTCAIDLNMELHATAEEKDAYRRARRAIVEQSEIKKADLILFQDRLLGKGAKGAVFEGVYCGTTVACKTLELTGSQKERERAVKYAKKEFAHTAKAKHPNIVAVWGICYEIPGKVHIRLPSFYPLFFFCDSVFFI
jgi:hypothetical protein